MNLLLDRHTRSEIARDNATDKLEARRLERQKREALHQKRQERAEALRQQREKRRTGRRAAVRHFALVLPSRLIMIPACLAAAAAWRGQEDWALTGLHWSFLWAAGLATALETLGFSLGAMARSARNDNDTAIVERALMWSVVGSSAWLNWTHSHQPVLGLMSISGVAGWEVYERRRHRHQVRATRPVARPRFGVARWMRFTTWTFTAWSVAVRDRLGAGDAVVALQRAELERRSRHITVRSRRQWASQVRAFIDDERTRVTERAERVLAEGNALLGAAALVFGADAVRDAATGTPSPDPRQHVTRKRHPWRHTTTPPSDVVTDQPELAGESPVDVPDEPVEHTATVTPIRSIANSAPSGEKLATMLAIFRAHAEQGRLSELTGAGLAREADATASYGRKYLPQWKRELESGVPLEAIGGTR